MQVEISHSEPLGTELPKQWSTFWQHILSRQAVAVYLALRGNAGAELDLDRWAAHLKMSRTRLVQSLRELEEHGFVSLGDGD
jgi:DNA-binding HxlR family transcriptional regulator